MEMLDFIYYYTNDEYKGKFEGPPSKKRIGGICRSEKGGWF